MLKCGFCGGGIPVGPKKTKTGKVNKNEKRRTHCCPKCRNYANQLAWLVGKQKKLMEENK